MNCLFCEHFYFFSCCPELMGAINVEMQCMKNHWEVDGSTTEKEFRQYMLTARTCKDYNPIHDDSRIQRLT